MNDIASAPSEAILGATQQFHEMLEVYQHFGGKDRDTTRRLYEDAHLVLELNKEMPPLTDGIIKNALGDGPDFQTWMLNGRTYASAARLIRAKLGPLLKGEVA